jgi:hypothetical protein
MTKKHTEDNQSQSHNIKPFFKITQVIDFENLWMWWLSILLLLASIVIYLSLNLSPLKEIIVLCGILIFIIVTVKKFYV